VPLSRISKKCLAASLVLFFANAGRGAADDELFREGAAAYRASDYAKAAKAYCECASRQPASGTLQNLGIAQWQCGAVGPAVLAWEQSLWLKPFERPARDNLRFARKSAQLDAPDLAWYEVVSSWFPSGWWAWIAGLSSGLAISMAMLPGILRLRKSGWHQAVAALALMVFLLSVPAQLGALTRSRIGFVLQKDTPLRLTPTAEAQTVVRLPAGKAARYERERGNYVLIRTTPDGVRGWLTREQFGLICSKPCNQ